MGDEYSTPRAEDLRAYLRLHDWIPQEPGFAGVLWFKDNARIGVPHESDDDLIRAVVERLARAEQRTARAVADGVRHLLYDVTHLRVANDYRITDKIPLGTASKIIASARMMLRATATTARWERAQIGGSYSRLGDDVIRDAFMGHTEKGSFVIPVLVPIPEPTQPDIHQPTLDHDTHDRAELHSAPAEPFERRVVRTFAQSMQAVHDVVVEPAHEPTTDQMYDWCIAV